MACSCFSILRQFIRRTDWNAGVESRPAPVRPAAAAAARRRGVSDGRVSPGVADWPGAAGGAAGGGEGGGRGLPGGTPGPAVRGRVGAAPPRAAGDRTGRPRPPPGRSGGGWRCRGGLRWCRPSFAPRRCRSHARAGPGGRAARRCRHLPPGKLLGPRRVRGCGSCSGSRDWRRLRKRLDGLGILFPLEK